MGSGRDPIKRIKLKSGKVRYRFVIDVGRDPETGRRQQKTFTFDSLKEATKERNRILYEKGEGTYVQPNEITVNEVLDRFLESATRDVEKNTASNYTKVLIPVRARLGEKPVQRLSEADVEKFIDWMLTSGRRTAGKPGTALSVRYVSLALNRLKAALEWARRPPHKLVGVNVAEFAKIPRSAKKADAAKRRAKKPWTGDEVRSFLSAIVGERLFVVELLSLMGLRPAEVCGLQWQTVDWGSFATPCGVHRKEWCGPCYGTGEMYQLAAICTDNTRTLVDREVEEKDAKTRSGNRTLPLPGTVAVPLRAFQVRQAAEKLAAGPAYADSGYVLVDELGEPQTTEWLRLRTYDLMAKVGMRRVRLYDARHSCLTYLASRGVPDWVLAAWAGHADGGALAKKIYVHADAHHLAQAAGHLDELFG